MPQTRRDFVKSSAALAATASIAPAHLHAYVAGSDSLRLGVVGAGGRGKGACRDSLVSSAGVELTAIGDLTMDISRNAREVLKGTEVGEQVTVADDALFGGLDAYRDVIHHPKVDVVLLTTSPGFRPIHLAEAVRAGKHVFMEKPVCVDPAGYRSCLESARIADEKGLVVVAGTMFRRQKSYIDAITQIEQGAIGRRLSGTARYCSQGIWWRNRQPGMSDLAYQLYNWYHHTWLSGDQIVEQAVHNIDAICWAMGGPPSSAYGNGGQFTRPEGSEIYDSMSIDYRWDDGRVVSFMCRQIPGSKPDISNTIVGTEGVAHVNPGGSRVVRHDGEVLSETPHSGPYPYVGEHADMIRAIRDSDHLNETVQVANSSLTAVMGRMAAYTGQEVTWDFVTKESTLKLMPDELSEDSPAPEPFVRIPGRHRLS